MMIRPIQIRVVNNLSLPLIFVRHRKQEYKEKVAMIGQIRGGEGLCDIFFF